VAVIGSVSVTGNLSSSAQTLATILDEATTLITYVGKSDPGVATSAASWQVQRLTSSASLLIVQFADGNSNFDNVWDNRASLSYS